MVDYVQARATAERLIKKYGQIGAIRRAGTDHPAPIALLGYKNKEIDGARIKDGDLKIYVTATATIGVQMGDVLVDKGGTPYSIVNVKKLAPAGLVVFYKAQCRAFR